jgi:hypothetical protein
MTSPIEVVYPQWSIPNAIKGLVTTRNGGFSLPPFDSLNLALHVGDDETTVVRNRELVSDYFTHGMPTLWLNQQHTSRCLYGHQAWSTPPLADAVWTDQPGLVLAVMTADCLPILITNQSGSLVCAVHAGWRGLVDGILTNTLAELPEKPQNLIAWIGPAISQRRFQVGDEVRQEFLQQNVDNDKAFIRDKSAEGKWLADLPAMAQSQLRSLGLTDVVQSGLCTYDDPRFFSYRKQGQTGRIASLIWIAPK